MHRGHAVVLCVPCGRRRYLEVLFSALAPFRGIVDRCELWLNTDDAADAADVRATAARDAWFALVEPPLPKAPRRELWRNVHAFYPDCCRPGTIYVKCDDDVVFVDSVERFRAFLDLRIDRPDVFLLSANVVNSPVCTHLHQAEGMLPGLTRTVPRSWFDDYGMSGPVAVAAHRAFLDRGARWFDMPDVDLRGERFAINWVAWLGEDFAAFDGRVPENDEEWLTTRPGRTNAIAGGFVVCHFAFARQRAHVDATDVLSRYRALPAT